MASPNREQEGYSSLEVFRRVRGLDKFLGLVHHYGYQIFGNDGITSYSTPYNVECGDKATTRYLVQDTGSPRLSVNDKPHLTLLYLQAPLRLNVHSNFNWLVNELNPNRRHKSELRRNLEQSGLQHDIPKQEGVQICCDDLMIQPNYLLNTKDLVLTLSESLPVTDMLKDQAGILARALIGHSQSKKAASPYMSPPGIPSARFPEDSSWDERNLLREELMQYIPTIGRLALGDFDCKVSIHTNSDLINT